MTDEQVSASLGGCHPYDEECRPGRPPCRNHGGTIPPIDDDARMKALHMFLGMLEGMHTNLDNLRDRVVAVDSNPIDHNIEQAQIALETASMRLQQVVRIVGDRMPEPEPEPEPIRGRCILCGDGVVWHPGNGGQWLGDTPPRDWATCHGSVDGPKHKAIPTPTTEEQP